MAVVGRMPRQLQLHFFYYFLEGSWSIFPGVLKKKNVLYGLRVKRDSAARVQM